MPFSNPISSLINSFKSCTKSAKKPATSDHNETDNQKKLSQKLKKTEGGLSNILNKTNTTNEYQFDRNQIDMEFDRLKYS